MAAIAMRLALMRPSMDQQDMKEDARSDIQQALAVTRILAVWRGKKTRERRVERRLPVVALLASIEVSKHRRRGFVQFILYLAYNWLLGALVLQVSAVFHCLSAANVQRLLTYLLHRAYRCLTPTVCSARRISRSHRLDMGIYI
mmetsp:Transcript_44106/g.101959  ORF Transcript_44106/g.101959 Transcript_44106/m.101959 type:complete len:144 (-) Transcript_44106:31-462(-)